MRLSGSAADSALNPSRKRPVIADSKTMTTGRALGQRRGFKNEEAQNIVVGLVLTFEVCRDNVLVVFYLAGVEGF